MKISGRNLFVHRQRLYMRSQVCTKETELLALSLRQYYLPQEIHTTNADCCHCYSWTSITGWGNGPYRGLQCLQVEIRLAPLPSATAAPEESSICEAEKCEFHPSSVSFLSYMIAKGQVTMDPAKMGVILEWSRPRTENRKASFYRQLIWNYSCMAAPLTHLTSTKQFRGHLSCQRPSRTWRTSSSRPYSTGPIQTACGGSGRVRCGC